MFLTLLSLISSLVRAQFSFQHSMAAPGNGEIGMGNLVFGTDLGYVRGLIREKAPAGLENATVAGIAREIV